MEQFDPFIKKAASMAVEAGNISMRITQDLVERSREVGLQSNIYDNSEEKFSEIRQNLDSKYDKEKLDGLKRLIAMISKGRNVAEFFPDVVKNVASTSFEVRKLVYIYLLKYAEYEPDLALLSINTFQKDMADKNPLIRAMALRVMSSIRVQVIAPLILMALKRGTADLSPYVRKAAANAIPKCFSLDPLQKDSLVEIIETLLNDNSVIVIGTVIASMRQVCPERFDLLHKHYRKLCNILIDVDEWSQLEIMDVLLRYARMHFLDPNRKVEKAKAPTLEATSPKKETSKDFFVDGEGSKASSESAILDPDHEFLLNSCRPMLQSPNHAVAFAAARMFLLLAPADRCQRPAKAIVRILHSHPESQYFILINLATIAEQRPKLIQPYFKSFYLFKNDAAFVQELKLDILGLIASEENVSMMMRELKDYVRGPDKVLVTKAMQLMGQLSTKFQSVAEDCLSVMMILISSDQADIVAEAVIVVRRLLQLQPASNKKLIVFLSKALDSITVPMARASILWLIGQYCELIPKVAPDSFRKALKGFTSESSIVKLQILNLGAKLMSVGPETEVVGTLFNYALNLARFDADYDVRDRGRFLKVLVLDKANLSVKDILLSPKTSTSQETTASTGRNRFVIGSLSHSLNLFARDYKPLPDWPEVAPDASLRKVPEPTSNWSSRDQVVTKSPVKEIRRAAAAKVRKPVDLDNFLDDSEESEEEESEEEDEEEEEDDEEEDEEEEEEEEDDEDEEENGEEEESEDEAKA
ncbi:adaptin N terminal region-domain-containing protein [Zopfochytrium polystomum]|nr:adaptin N terminal region-domain-containing protein [Zopfochytrium polystomum]